MRYLVYGVITRKGIGSIGFYTASGTEWWWIPVKNVVAYSRLHKKLLALITDNYQSIRNNFDTTSTIINQELANPLIP